MAVYSLSFLASDIPSTTSDPVPVYSFSVGVGKTIATMFMPRG